MGSVVATAEDKRTRLVCQLRKNASLQRRTAFVGNYRFHLDLAFTCVVHPQTIGNDDVADLDGVAVAGTPQHVAVACQPVSLRAPNARRLASNARRLPPNVTPLALLTRCWHRGIARAEKRVVLLDWCVDVGPGQAGLLHANTSAVCTQTGLAAIACPAPCVIEIQLHLLSNDIVSQRISSLRKVVLFILLPL